MLPVKRLRSTRKEEMKKKTSCGNVTAVKELKKQVRVN